MDETLIWVMTERRSNKGPTTRRPVDVGGNKKFHLPWLATWRNDFLECSRILSRERQADEIAQRLLYRLRLGLRDRGKSLDDVKVLACVTTPAMLLAAAIHRWWPNEVRPAIADLGYYLMLSTPKELPVVIKTGGVVVVQDVLDTSQVSGALTDALAQQHIEVLCVLGLVHLVPDGLTRVTPVNFWWTPTDDGYPHHALVETRRPEACEPPQSVDEDSRAFWIEPRSLHPLRYTTLRRELVPGRDPLLDRRDTYLKQFDNSDKGCLLTAGHYVYGRRHYSVTIDIRRALEGKIGDDIAFWLADICEGRKQRDKRKWETGKGRDLQGDVTAVLMPLHSQIHYIWPKVVNLLAQRGRRPMSWWLEATLFTGSGQDYFLPAQFEDQIRVAVKEAITSSQPPQETIKNPLRILILDDAIASARTAENIITTILRKVRKAFVQISKELNVSNRTMDKCPKPIKWIRYFSFLNQMDNARHVLWHSIPFIAKKRIPIVFEEFAPFMGVPIYDNETCPTCRDVIRLDKLIEKAARLEAEEPRLWAMRRSEELQPIAVDSPDFRGPEPKMLETTINILAARSALTKTPEKYQFVHADTAIWRFYELMYLSYPPNDILTSLESIGDADVDSEQRHEYMRYEWAVLQWCLHHWSRIRANAAESIFIECCKKQIVKTAFFAEPIAEAASVHYRDRYITNFIAYLITELATLDRQRELREPIAPKDSERARHLETALTLFFLNVPPDDLQRLYYGDLREDNKYDNLLAHLDRAGRHVSRTGHNVLRNLHLTLTRPQRYAEPLWALEAVAESLYRGRDPDKPEASSHELLPRLLAEVRGAYLEDRDRRRLCRTSLVVFLGGLEDIKHYCGWEFSTGVALIESFSRKVLEWLKLSPGNERYKDFPPELNRLEDAIDSNKEFCTMFDEIFHMRLDRLVANLEREAKAIGGDRLEFSFLMSGQTVERCRVLTNVQGLMNCLANLTINPVNDPLRKNDQGIFKSKIVVGLRDELGPARLNFRLLTNFATLEDTRIAVRHGPSGAAELAMLATFGAAFDSDWEAPSTDEQAVGFSAAYNLSVMTGFVPRNLR